MLGYILLALVALFFAVILIRAAMFRPKAQPVVGAEKVEFDEQAAVDAVTSEAVVNLMKRIIGQKNFVQLSSVPQK